MAPPVTLPIPAAVFRRMAAILLAALVIGFAYNALNPAGLKWSQPADSARADVSPYTHQLLAITPYVKETKAGPAAAVKPTQGAPAPVYTHSTVSIGWGPGTQAQRAATQVPAIAKVTWEDVQAMRAKQNAVLVDGRAKQSYETAHIPGAVSLPLGSLATEIEAFKSRYSVRTPLIVYCSNQLCSIAEKLARSLLWDHGYRNVFVMPGGYLEYRSNQK